MKDIVISGSTYPGVEQILFDTPSGKRATFVDFDTVHKLKCGVSVKYGRAFALKACVDMTIAPTAAINLET